ncbi:MAG: hypothetical protein WA070_17260 [Sphingobium sp.]
MPVETLIAAADSAEPVEKHRFQFHGAGELRLPAEKPVGSLTRILGGLSIVFA